MVDIGKMDTRESANFARIACLAMQEGTDRICMKIVNNIEGKMSFHEALQNKEHIFKSLKTKRVLSKAQYAILFPDNGRAHLSNIDMTLWIIMARNLTVGKRHIRWNECPKETDLLWQHDVIRLREIRNKLFHLKKPEHPSQDYIRFKDTLVSVLTRLGSPEDVIFDYFSRDLDPDQTRISCAHVREQCLQEIHQIWLASVYGKKYMRNLAILLSVLIALVVLSIAIPVGIQLNETPPCASAVEKIKYTSESTTLNFMRRSGWGALPRRDVETNPIPVLEKPVKMAVVFSTDIVENCDVTTDCCATVKYLQKQAYASERVKWQDLPYNFLIGNDGVVYEGRGAHYIGGAAWRRNTQIVSIAFLGNFICTPPSRAAILALYAFLEYIQHGDPSTGTDPSQAVLDPGYTLYGLCQVNLRTPEHNFTFPNNPGAAFMREIRLWKRLGQENMTNCLLDVDCMSPADCCVPCTQSP